MRCLMKGCRGKPTPLSSSATPTGRRSLTSISKRRTARGGQAAHQGRGPADGGQHRQAAGAAADLKLGSGHVYSITLSARANNAGGTVTPIALAVLRLITSSNLVGCSTGMSATLMQRTGARVSEGEGKRPLLQVTEGAHRLRTKCF
jgi:hypothetical protein